MRIRRSRRQERRGVAMVECGFIIPIITMTVLGVIEISRALEVSQILTAAAREGGRLGMLRKLSDQEGTMNAKVTADIKHFIAAQGIDPGVVTVEIVDAQVPGDDPPEVNLDVADRDTYFMVRVSANYEDVSFGVAPVFLDDAVLSGTIRLRHE